MRNFKASRTLNVPQKCSVRYYTNAETLKISKKIVRSVEYSPRPYIEEFLGVLLFCIYEQILTITALHTIYLNFFSLSKTSIKSINL